jgi:single-strand DNA-binding protein
MANDLNVVAVTGRLTRDSELRYSNGGMAIAKFCIAVNRRAKGADGQWADEASFFDCSMFGKAAEGVNQYLNKGTHVAINGELRQNRWEQEGQTRSKVELIVNSLTLLGSSQDGQNQRQATSRGNPAPRPAASTPTPSYAGPEQFDDDQIPF